MEPAGRLHSNEQLTWPTVNQVFIKTAWATHIREQRDAEDKDEKDEVKRLAWRARNKRTRPGSEMSIEDKSDSATSEATTPATKRQRTMEAKDVSSADSDVESAVPEPLSRLPKPALADLLIYAVCVYVDENLAEEKPAELVLYTVPVSYSECMTAAYQADSARLDFARFSKAAAPGTLVELDAKSQFFRFQGGNRWNIPRPSSEYAAGLRLASHIQEQWNNMDTQEDPFGVNIFHTTDTRLMELVPNELRG